MCVRSLLLQNSSGSLINSVCASIF
uniref:Uncharacterized protein n=1 Tax=Arundo donax TaxID=35708 RepID=A0A0A9FRX1_ARUDO